jgi:hypothetical protein
MTPSHVRKPEPEAIGLMGLLDRYRIAGFEVKLAPSAADVPSFARDALPDAIAVNSAGGIAVFLPTTVTRLGKGGLSAIARRFAQQPGWRAELALPVASPEDRIRLHPQPIPVLRAELANVAELFRQGYRRAAFVMAWSLLESSSHSVPDGSSLRPRSPTTTAITLESLGLIDSDMAAQLGAQADLRNRIVHGGMDADPTADDFELVLSAARHVIDHIADQEAQNA